MFTVNVPNVLTLLRILLVPVLVVALLDKTSDGDVLAAVVFAVASFTDAIDGYIARSRNAITTFGKLMDPVADKLLIIAALFSLVSLQRLPAWVAMVIVAREFAVTIEFIGPLAVAVVGSRRRLDLVWAALAAVGIVLLANPGGANSVDPLGLFFILCAAACWAGYILLAQRAGQVFSGSQGVAMAMVVAALIPIAPGIIDAGSALLRPELLAIGCAVGLLSSAIPYSLETEALRRMPANVFGVLMSMEPAVAALAGFVVLGQDLGVRELIAMAFVVAASAGVSIATPPEA